MSLKLLHAVIQDLETENAVAKTLVDRWEHDPDSARFLRASANFVFTFTDGGVPRVLRFNRLEDRNVEAIRAELELVRHLGSQGVLVAQPVPSRSGHDVERVSTPLGDFSAASFEFISGTQPDLDELTEEHLTAWGGALAALHNATAGYSAPDRPSWQEHLAMTAENLPAGPGVVRELLRRVQHELERLPITKDGFGLIHFDFEPDNLVWQERRVWAVDFDDCAHYPLVADIAFALRERFGDQPSGVNPNDNRFNTFVGGYRAIRSVSDENLSYIPLFLAAHNLLNYAKLRCSLVGAPDPDEPEWLVRLRRRLEVKVAQYEQSFAQVATG